jgi:cytochrome P450
MEGMRTMTDTMQADAPPVEIDLYSAASFSNGHPFEQYRWLRANAPVYRHPAPDGGFFWAVTRNADIRWTEHNSELFSASPGVAILDAPFETGFLAMDAPRHPQFRRVIAPRLVPPRVKMMLPNLQRIASEILDEVAPRGECDLVNDVAGPMAGYTAADLLGIPRAAGKRLHELFMIVHSSPDVVGEEAMTSAQLEIASMGIETFAEKRRNPGDDVFSSYAIMEVDGRPITEMEFVGNYVLLTDGGLDTSRNLISGGMKLLFEHPEVRRQLVADFDGLLPGAIEEMLRLLTPVVYIRRIALQDIEIGGQAIAKGDRVAIYYGSGNRDEEVYPDPEAFDISRKSSEHVAFGGGGPHFCVGSHLGRAEGSVAIREVLTRLPDIEQAGPATWAPTSLTSGLETLPVRFTAVT